MVEDVDIGAIANNVNANASVRKFSNFPKLPFTISIVHLVLAMIMKLGVYVVTKIWIIICEIEIIIHPQFIDH